MDVPLEFTNTSGRTCTLYGYPGVALTATAPGAQVGAAAERSSVRPATLITLAPGVTASATLQLVNVSFYSASACGPVSAGYLQVYPPGQTSAVYVPNTGYTGQACTKAIYQLGVSTVAVGTALAF
jgi:hypothetical protein